jgi:hypothetical protein
LPVRAFLAAGRPGERCLDAAALGAKPGSSATVENLRS